MRIKTASWAALSLVSACWATAPGAPPGDLRSAPPVTISLRIGQTARFHDLEIGFTAVPQDSRCPVDVQCITAGNAVAEVAVGPALGRGPTYQLALNTTEGAHHGVAWDVRVALVRLEPEPLSTRFIKPADYRLTLRVGGADSGGR